MKFLKKIPMFGYLFVLINIFVLIGKGDIMNHLLFKLKLISGAVLHLTIGYIFIIAGLACLTIQVFKATRTSQAEITDHIFSTLIFVLFLVEFIIVLKAGNPEFFILCLMSLMAVIAGFSITIASARRDITMDKDSGINVPRQ